MLVVAAPVAGMLPPNPMLPLVRGRTGSLDKAPWKTVEPPLSTVEKKFLRPALLGESVAPFRILVPQRAVIPWDAEWHELLDAQKASGRGYPKLAQWLTETEALWERHKPERPEPSRTMRLLWEAILPVPHCADSRRVHEGRN